MQPTGAGACRASSPGSRNLSLTANTWPRSGTGEALGPCASHVQLFVCKRAVQLTAQQRGVGFGMPVHNGPGHLFPASAAPKGGDHGLHAMTDFTTSLPEQASAANSSDGHENATQGDPVPCGQVGHMTCLGTVDSARGDGHHLLDQVVSPGNGGKILQMSSKSLIYGFFFGTGD